MEPLHEWRMVAFSLDRYVRGDLVLFAERYVVFTEIAVIREDVSNGSERLVVTASGWSGPVPVLVCR